MAPVLHATPGPAARARAAGAPYHGASGDFPRRAGGSTCRHAPAQVTRARPILLPAAPPTDAVQGRLLDGRYRVGPRIARGGMASVYEALDVRLDRTVAVKVMHAGLSDSDCDRDFAERFVREARAAARLSHPHVVAVHDQGDEDGTVFLVMELVTGHTLRDTIAKESPMPAARALALIEPVALRAGRRPPRRADPPRRQARERPDRRRRPGQGRRLRPGQGDQRRHPAHRHAGRADRHRVLPRPRAGHRRPRRRARRRLRRGRAALRAAHRRQAARGRDPDRGRLQARPPRRAAAVGAGARPAAVRRRARRPRHRPRPHPSSRRRRGAAPPGAPGQPGAGRGAARRPRAHPGPAAHPGRRATTPAAPARRAHDRPAARRARLAAPRPAASPPRPLPLLERPAAPARARAARAGRARPRSARQPPRGAPAASAGAGAADPCCCSSRCCSPSASAAARSGTAGPATPPPPPSSARTRRAAVAALEGADLEVAYADPVYDPDLPAGAVVAADPRRRRAGAARRHRDPHAVPRRAAGARGRGPRRGRRPGRAARQAARVRREHRALLRERARGHRHRQRPRARHRGRARHRRRPGRVARAASRSRVGTWVGESARARRRRRSRSAAWSVEVVDERLRRRGRPRADVISQDPSVGTLNRGDTVELVVSRGPELVEVPDTYLFGVEAAEAAMRDAGFDVEVEDAAGGFGLGYVIRRRPRLRQPGTRGQHDHAVRRLTVVTPSDRRPTGHEPVTARRRALAPGRRSGSDDAVPTADLDQPWDLGGRGRRRLPRARRRGALRGRRAPLPHLRRPRRRRAARHRPEHRRRRAGRVPRTVRLRQVDAADACSAASSTPAPVGSSSATRRSRGSASGGWRGSGRGWSAPCCRARPATCCPTPPPSRTSSFARLGAARGDDRDLPTPAELLEVVGLADQRDQTVSTMSGGQRQRLALACAVATGPRLLLADEPTSALGHDDREAVVALLHRIGDDFGTTVVVVTHQAEVAATFPRTVTMKGGRIGAEGRSGSEYAVVGEEGLLHLPEPARRAVARRDPGPHRAGRRRPPHASTPRRSRRDRASRGSATPPTARCWPTSTWCSSPAG